MYGAIKEHLEKELEEIKEAGLYKKSVSLPRHRTR